MNEQPHTRVTDPSGNVHTGSGPQYNNAHHYNVTMIDPSALSVSTKKATQTLAPEDLSRLRRHFVPPSGLGTARAKLSERGTVLLCGAPGSGRRSAALMLLWESHRGPGRLHQLDEQETEANGSVLDTDQIEAEDRMLLDLTSTDDDRIRQQLSALPHFRAALRERGASLAIVMDSRQRQLVPAEFASFVVEVENPEPLRVLKRTLLYEGVEPDAREWEAPRLTAFLSSAGTGTVAELAAAILHERQHGRPADTFALWRDRALAKLAPLERKEVVARIERLLGGTDAALVLTTALLPGARADFLESAAEDMLAVLRHPADDQPVLGRTALTARLNAFDARLGEGNRVELSDGFAAAARDYFWDNYPALRHQLVPWAERTVSAPALAKEERYAFVDRYVEQCLRVGTPEPVQDLVARWTRPDSTQAKASMAARALTLGVLDRRHGSCFRRQIYDWARKPGLSPARAHVVVGVCRGALAASYPDQAVTRLLHLARRQRGTAGDEARDKLLELTGEDARLYRRALSALVGDAGAPQPVDSRLFIALAAPERLTAPRDGAPALIRGRRVREQLSEGWRRAFTQLPAEAWRRRLADWLDEAARNPAEREALLHVLVGSCGPRGSALTDLYGAVRKWASAAEDRSCVFDAFWEACAAALGLDPSVTGREARA
ncbi:hypothetical protein [Streptomyces albus]|uniref:hypothetical protein n=1 Tax=Streptomyces albus TaxID=1888 RepID=UPI0034564EED